DWKQANGERARLLNAREHTSYEESFRVTDVFNVRHGKLTSQQNSSVIKEPSISIVIVTRNNARLLQRGLESFVAQTLPKEQYEIVVIDDGSTDTTASVCERFLQRAQLNYMYQEHSGMQAAYDLGIFASRGR